MVRESIMLKRFKWQILIFLLGGAAGITAYVHLVSSGWVPPPATEVEVFFSPRGRTRDRIIRAANLCKKTFDAAVFDLSAGLLAQAVADLHGRGKTVRVIVDNRQAFGTNSSVCYLKEYGVDVRVATGGKGGGMHHKFLVVDGTQVLTGSYNWSDGAEERNSENLLVLKDEVLAELYAKEFERVWARAKPLYILPEKDRKGKRTCGVIKSAKSPKEKGGAWRYIVQSRSVHRLSFTGPPEELGLDRELMMKTLK